MTKGTIQNRESFLNRIAAQLGREVKQEAEKPQWEFQPQWEVNKGKSQDELLEVFKKACEAVHIKVFETCSDKLSELLPQVVEAYGGGPVSIGEDERFQIFQLEEVLNEIGAQVWDVNQGKANIDQAAEANIGITFSDIALAESGTTVFFHDKNKARSITLLPVTSIIIIPKKQLVPRLSQATKLIHERVQSGDELNSYINFVSGPSNSADIEMNMVIGVHGPVNVAYIVVE